MSSPGRVAAIGGVLAGAFFVASLAVIPVRVSFGAGSVRCGTALRSDRSGEISRLAEVCPEAGHERVRRAAAGSFVLLVIGLLPLALRRWTGRHRSLRLLVIGAVGLSWAVAIPLAVLFVTGAYPADERGSVLSRAGDRRPPADGTQVVDRPARDPALERLPLRP